jgi:diguanylate cyclase (GGDEF)-like protein
MVGRLQQWIVRNIAAGAFSDRRGVLRFAVTRSIWTTIAATIFNFVIYQVFGRLGILYVTVPPHPWADVVVTAFVAAPICFLAYYVLGDAIRKLAVSRDAFERLSRVDPLTGLLNRRAFTEAVGGLVTPYVIGVIDIDRFKLVNDTYGHAAGDRVLVEVAEELRVSFGGDAVLARLGGEEFGIAIPDVGRDTVFAMLDRARVILARRIFNVAGVEISVTFSAGLSNGGGEEGYSALMTDADKALYLAKAAGRNRIVHADEVAALGALAERSARQLAG